MLTEKEIEHIAQLARIKLTEKEKEKMKNELSSILDYIEQLKKINTDQTEALYQTTGLVNSVREDDYRGEFKINEELNTKLVGQAPCTQNRFVKVKSVLSKS